MALLGHPAWVLLVLLRSDAWSWLVPWPLPWVLYAAPHLRPRFRERRERPAWTRSNPAATAALLLAVLSYLVQTRSPSVWSRLSMPWDELFDVFLAGTAAISALIGLALALPGASILRLTVEKDTMATVHYVSPYLWALLLSFVGLVVSAAALAGWADTISLPDHHWEWMCAAVTGGLAFALLALSQATLHTVRLFGFGLLLAAREQRSAEDPRGQ